MTTLTRREAQCLALAAEGATYRETAGALGISWHTVNVFLGRARRKLDVTTTTGAVAAAIRRGILA